MSRCDVGLIDLERISPSGRFFWLHDNLDFHTVNHVMPCMVEMSPNSQEILYGSSLIYPQGLCCGTFLMLNSHLSILSISHILIASGEYPTPSRSTQLTSPGTGKNKFPIQNQVQ